MKFDITFRNIQKTDFDFLKAILKVIEKEQKDD